MSRLVRVEVDLNKFKKYRNALMSKVKGDGPGTLTDELKNFGQSVLNEVLSTYERTASWKEDAVRKRIYKYGTDNPMAGVLAHQLDYVAYEREENRIIVYITNPTLYPLGGGYPYYALWQEMGSAGEPMTPYIMRYIARGGELIPVIHPGLPARQFINAGYVFAYNNAQKHLDDLLKRWAREAENEAS